MDASSAAPASPLPAPEVMLEAENRTVRSGANWFYWIAALSLINTVLKHSGASIQFVFGLALTQLIDSFAAQAFPSVRWISLATGLAMGGLLVFLGWKAGKAIVWAFVAGLTVFLLDCALFGWIVVRFGSLEQGGIVGMIVRALALYWFFLGVGAARRLSRAKTAYALATADRAD